MNDSEKNNLYFLILKMTEGDISPEEKLQLEDILKTDSEAARMYVEFIGSISYMHKKNSVSLSARDAMDTIIQKSIWRSLEAQETTANACECAIDVERTLPEEVKIVVGQRKPLSRQTVNRLRFIAAMIPVVFGLFLYIQSVSVKKQTVFEVATIVDSMDVKWLAADSLMSNGTRLLNSGKMLELGGGLVELAFDNDARVVIEAPASFEILSVDSLKLNYGKIYARVPKSAVGFTVYSHDSKIIDLGTEFGVYASSEGVTELQVVKGKTKLIAGDQSNGIPVGSGQAKRVSGISNIVTDISYNETRHVRDFDSRKDILWYDQPIINLSDLLAGGNGRGTAGPNVILHPQGTNNRYLSSIFDTSDIYYTKTDNVYIDGLFVPGGQTGDQIVSSLGHIFKDCPPTSGIFDNQIMINPKAEVYKTDLRTGTLYFNGQYYGYGGKSCMVLHSNLGITIDLDAIRRSYDRKVASFSCKVGIADLNEIVNGNADFWVLIDGEVRYSLEKYNERSVLNDVQIEINDKDRFLTLATTDGGDIDQPEAGFYNRSISCDWCVFAEPVLVLE